MIVGIKVRSFDSTEIRTVLVKAEKVRGSREMLGIHRPFDAEDGVKNVWNITHAPSGMAFRQHIKGLKNARELAAFIVDLLELSSFIGPDLFTAFSSNDPSSKVDKGLLDAFYRALEMATTSSALRLDAMRGFVAELLKYRA